ncbi:MAG: hypothetical protein AAF236_07705 [Verrucomicrobiota bacterium]
MVGIIVLDRPPSGPDLAAESANLRDHDSGSGTRANLRGRHSLPITGGDNLPFSRPYQNY